MKIAFSKPQSPSEGTIVVGVLEGRVPTAAARALDDRSGGALMRAMAASRFEGKRDQSLAVLAPAGLAIGRILLLGLGKAEMLDALAAQGLGGVVAAQLASSGETHAWLELDPPEGAPLGAAELAANLAFGLRLRAYQFDKYLTKRKAEDKPSLKKVTLLTESHSAAKAAFQPLDKVADGVLLARDLVSEPANVIHPESLAEEARKLAFVGVSVEVLGEKQMRKLGMGALLGVGQGSARESQLVVLRWMGAKNPDAAPVVFVGKGVTFDSGGISLKAGQGMEDMKWDMAGAAAVIGAIRALAGRQAAVNAVGVVGLVENMPSSTAQRPGDVVTSMSGQTIEVINTDAEGRLVLADALFYAQQRFKPACLIDLATLTGSIVISLGNEYAGLFASDDELARRLVEAGAAAGEPLWRMPMGDAYDKLIKSDIADMKNVGGRDGGSITAAQFLKRFVNKVPWAHLDIAGMAWVKKDLPVCPKGATAFGVRLLDRLVADHYEDRAIS